MYPWDMSKHGQNISYPCGRDVVVPSVFTSLNLSVILYLSWELCVLLSVSLLCIVSSQEPDMNLDITSMLSGQSYDQLTTLIRSQVFIIILLV